jgi:hypothetical protein
MAIQMLAKFIKNMFYNMFFYLVRNHKCRSFVSITKQSLFTLKPNT